MSISCPAFPCGKTSDQPGQGIRRSRGGLPFVICPHVRNNPIIYIDPDGHKPKKFIPDPEDLLTKASINVNLASSIHTNTLGSQLNYDYRHSGVVYNNLCGHISVEMIYETAFGLSSQLDHVIDTLNITSGTGVGDLAYIFDQITVGFVGIVYDGANVNYYGMENLGYSCLTKNNLKERLLAMLAAGHYVIIGVSIEQQHGLLTDRRDTAHWVVVTGIDENYVYINNPFNNEKEKYTWDFFLSSVLAFDSEQISALEIINPGYYKFIGKLRKCE